MMKKHDEGYVLAFVMVVIVVLCLVAVSLMSISLRNLEAQNASIQRMEDKYVAMGKIEQVVAILNATDGTATGKTDADVAITSILPSELGATVQVTKKNGAAGEYTGFTATVAVVTQSNNLQISCLLEWNGVLDNSGGTYIVTTTGCKYTSYQISTVEEVGG